MTNDGMIISHSDLQIGDVVAYYGLRLRITALHHEVTFEDGTHITNWLTEYVDGSTGYEPFDCDAKRGNTHIQGNQHASAYRFL